MCRSSLAMARVEAVIMRLGGHAGECLLLVICGRSVVHDVGTRSAVDPVAGVHIVRICSRKREFAFAHKTVRL